MVSMGPKGTLAANTYRAPRRSAMPRMTARGRGLPDLPGRQVAVVHHRVGDHPDVVAGRVNPPAEVEVVAHQGQVGVEAADLVPDITADQHARRTHRQHRPVAVVLALVDLARLDPGAAPSRPVDGDARLTQHPPVGQVLQLGAEHRRGPVAAGHPEHLLQGVRRRLAVIVQQPDPLRQPVRRHRSPARACTPQVSSARATAVPYPVSASMPKTASGPSSSASTAPLRSWLPVSTPTARATDGSAPVPR